MDTSFYTYTSKRLTQSSHNSFSIAPQQPKSAASTIYSIEDDADTTQHPMGILSDTQVQFIKSFMEGLCGKYISSIDRDSRTISWIGFWKPKDKSIFVSAYVVQPQLSTATCQIKTSNPAFVSNYCMTQFNTMKGDKPMVQSIRSGCQLLGRYTVPVVDALISDEIVEPNRITWSMILLSKMQPTFCIVRDDTKLECIMTHESCRLIQLLDIKSTTISSPVTNSLNYTFRSKTIVTGFGSGPNITLHSQGILQYAGNPYSAYEVALCFRDCIYQVMSSSKCDEFLRSLRIVRQFDL